MSAATKKSSVEFTESGAIYRPGNGNVIKYKKVGGLYYHLATPDAVVQALEWTRSNRQRIRIYLGDTTTGRDWLEEHDVEGYIGNSMGLLRVPLLVHNRRSMGGPALLDHCIVKIKRTTGGGVLYRHARYHAGTFNTREVRPDETVQGRRLVDLGYTHAVDVDGSNHANFKSLPAAQRYVRRMTT
jgi:hypothetical protein